MNRQALVEVMPVWPGIAPEAQKAVVDHITANHFLDWEFDVFKLEVRPLRQHHCVSMLLGGA